MRLQNYEEGRDDRQGVGPQRGASNRRENELDGRSPQERTKRKPETGRLPPLPDDADQYYHRTGLGRLLVKDSDDPSGDDNTGEHDRQ